MSTAKKLSNEKRKLKNMSKVELQRIIIMKKQCDAKALAIVEQLLEPVVNSDWLLQNLRFLKKCHMEDVIEERTILKLCGYVLCPKPLTIIIQQQYHISTRSNKVYDISKRKKFCSSSCYGASNYLLQQMLDSPLWLRDKEEIPVFKILSCDTNCKFAQCVSGEEVNILGNNQSQDVTDNKIKTDNNKECNMIERTKEDVLCDTSSFKEEDTYSSCSVDDVNAEKDVCAKQISINNESQELPGCEINPSKLHKNPRNEDCNLQEKENRNDDTPKLNTRSENAEVERQSKEILRFHEHDTDAENKNFERENVTCNKDKTLQSQLDDTDNKTDRIEAVQPQVDKICSSSTIISSDSLKFSTKHRKNKDADKSNKTKKFKQKEANKVEATTDVYCNLIARVEQSVREWVTENTLCLLLGKEDERNRLLESLMRQERYQKLCKKLDRLQLEDKVREQSNLERDTLKPLPNFSALEEEGKKMELKVRAFYAGETTFPLSGDSSKESENKDDNDEAVLPLTEKSAPNAIRRRIFLDKLNTILPDLLRTLANNANVSSMMQYTHNNESYSLIKILVSTFKLSAGNIIFKTGEWTLLGLVIIKMLSLIDAKLQSLLRSKQASMYTSMILTLYKLDSNYLDRLVMEVTI